MYDFIKQSYDDSAEQYGELFYHELKAKSFDRKLLLEYLRSLPEGGRVCELGCGPGQVGRFLQDRGLQVTGVDLSSKMIRVAKKLNPKMTFLVGDMRDLSFLDGEWDGVVAFYSIIHLERADVVDFFRECYNTFAPGTRFLLAFHRGEGVVTTDDAFGRQIKMAATMFLPGEMANYAEQGGWKIEQLQVRPPYEFEYESHRCYLLLVRPQ